MQKLIIKNSASDFRLSVNEFLEKGYKVVPGTLVVNSYVIHNHPEYILTVVLEKGTEEFELAP